MESNLLMEIAKISPGIAGMGYLAWLSYSRSKESEKHVQSIHDSFITHIEKKEDAMNREREARDKLFREIQKDHAMYYKAEQDKFGEFINKLEAKH